MSGQAGERAPATTAHTDDQGEHSKLADKARTLISRFIRFEDMILRFAADLSAPFTNNEAERACRPRQDSNNAPPAAAGAPCKAPPTFAIVQSYLDTATKWGLDKLDALRQLFTTGTWLPPTLKIAE